MKLVVHAYEGEAFFDLIDQVEGVDWIRTTAEADLLREITDADAFFGFPNSAVMQAASRLKWVQSPGAGVNLILSVPELVKCDVILTNTRGAHAASIAEHVFGMLLALTRAIPTCVKWQQEHYWGRDQSVYRIPREIMGSTIGIVGYGQIGRMVAKRSLAFDLNVLAIDQFPGGGDDYVDSVWGVDRLHELLSASDIVVIAAPATAETQNLIDASAFAAMKSGGYLIAISRGGIVNEDALLEALNCGKLAGAGLDVTETEPLPVDSALWDTRNLLITPHLAGSSWQKEKRCVEILVENLGRFQRGEELMNVVDKQAGF